MRSLHSSISGSSIVQSQHSHTFNLNKAERQSPTPPKNMGFGSRQSEKRVVKMAYVSNNRTATETLSGRFAALRANAVEGFNNWRVYRITLAELNMLSPREMADLGINPSMIRRIALEAAYGKNV
jgi:uncharacterized protein YjiS (DUF1127 family)